MTLLNGQKVERICFDFGVTLFTESSYELRLETAFVVRSGANESAMIEPEGVGSAASQVLALLHRVIRVAQFEKSGSLKVGFADGMELTSEPNQQFEAWSIAGPGMARVVCLPGGGVTEWTPAEGGSTP